MGLGFRTLSEQTEGHANDAACTKFGGSTSYGTPSKIFDPIPSAANANLKLDMADPSQLLHLWKRLAPLPGGKWLFSRLLGRAARYTGSIKPLVLELEPGKAVVRMRDRAAVRNHLRSVHAIALINLGEISTGLATISCLGPGRRGIVTQLSMSYEKKARGPLTSTTCFPPPADDFEGALTVEANIVDEEGDVVAVATAEWTIGNKPT